ncbi:hypothetical protein LX32DRAFT_657435 [Colletotrichum zoysiae]|uniref:Uncharacterized protein n=1 Tax=Colletotrichum zoysiae TaxID=1216348 RepID=A0AAD9LYC5_9PEZI|nr:hypothetical protein LX32DRAFT_657435 [Colletotrichum zoysiae]
MKGENKRAIDSEQLDGKVKEPGVGCYDKVFEGVICPDYHKLQLRAVQLFHNISNNTKMSLPDSFPSPTYSDKDAIHARAREDAMRKGLLGRTRAATTSLAAVVDASPAADVADPAPPSEDAAPSPPPAKRLRLRAPRPNPEPEPEVEHQPESASEYEEEDGEENDEEESDDAEEEQEEQEEAKKTVEREIPCLPCVDAALHGNDTGACFEAKIGGRCARCSKGRSLERCVPTPGVALAAVAELRELLEVPKVNRSSRWRTDICNIRVAVRYLLANADAIKKAALTGNLTGENKKEKKQNKDRQKRKSKEERQGEEKKDENASQGGVSQGSLDYEGKKASLLGAIVPLVGEAVIAPLGRYIDYYMK